MIVRELINLIGFEVDAQAESKARQALAGMAKAAKVAAAATAAGAAAAGIVAKTAADSINELARSARDANVSTDTFQAVTGAIQALGGEAEDARAGMAELALRAQEALEDPGGSMAERFARYGIAVADANGQLRSVPDLMADIADASQALEQAGQSAKFLQDELIGDTDAQAFSELFSMGAEGFRAELDRIRDSRFFVSEDEVESAKEFGRTFSLLQNIATDLFRKFGAALLPVITQTAQAVVKFIAANRDIITGGIQRGVELLSTVFGGLRNVFFRLADAAGGVDRLFKLIAAGAGIVAVAMFGPAIAIGAVVAALALLIDEFSAWASGAPSMVGEFLGPFEAMPGSIRAIFDIIGDTVRSFIDLVEAIFMGDLGGIMDALGDILLSPVRLILNGLAGLVDGAIGIINGLIAGIPDFLLPSSIEGGIEFNAADAVQSLINVQGANEAAQTTVAEGSLGVGPGARAAADNSVKIGDTTINATISVPEGTSREQVEFLRDKFAEIADERIKADARNTREDAPDMFGAGA